MPREAIESIWISFNIHGEGWGLDIYQFREIFSQALYMKESIGMLFLLDNVHLLKYFFRL